MDSGVIAEREYICEECDEMVKHEVRDSRDGLAHIVECTECGEETRTRVFGI